MGEGGVGALLVVGSQGNMGCHYLVLVPYIYTLPPTAQAQRTIGALGATALVRASADVLVGY